MASATLTDLETQLATARSDSSAVRARATFRKIAQLGAELAKEPHSSSQAAIIASAAYSDAAGFELNREIRLGARRSAIRVLRAPAGWSKDPVLVTGFANRAVDLFYDRYAREETPTVRSLLAQASKALVDVGQTLTNDMDQAQLLIQRSSVLRCQAQIGSGQEKTARLKESVRAARRAVEQAPDFPFAKVELGQALWTSARLAQTDEQCFAVLNEAEQQLSLAQSSTNPLSRLVLSRFYRQSFRPARAVDVFREYDQLERSYRRRLSTEAYLVGEAARLMWFRDYEESYLQESLEYAETILLEAIDSGYQLARNFVALAFIRAALGRVDASQHALAQLMPERVSSWLEVISRAESAIEQGEFALLESAFSLGIADSNVWSGLGSYVRVFDHDDASALRLYEVARRLDPRNHVVLTNIARLRIRSETVRDLGAADEALRIAAAHSPRTFVWWRGLRDELKQILGEERPPRTQLRRPASKRANFKDIQLRWQELRNPSEELEPHRRGYLVQALVADLLSLTFGQLASSGSHRVEGREIDAGFLSRDHWYRVEVKWTKERLSRDQLDALNEILRQAEVRGLVISINGFTDEAVEYARRLGEAHGVLLMDGEELDMIVRGMARFETVIERKWIHLLRTKDPYLRATEESVD